MSIAPAAAAPPRTEGAETDAVRRVRHQARDAAALMAFSAATSVAVATVFLVLAFLARQA
jgi:hypothetical protein